MAKERVFAYMCVRKRERDMRVCACVCKRERESERERVIEKESNLNLIDRCNEAKMKTKQNIFFVE